MLLAWAKPNANQHVSPSKTHFKAQFHIYNHGNQNFTFSINLLLLIMPRPKVKFGEFDEYFWRVIAPREAQKN